MVTDDRINLFSTFTLDLARGCVLDGARPIHLRRQAYEVLRYLVENRGHLISKDQLITEIWQGRAVTDGSLGKCIEEVREALGPEARQFLRNVRGRGYIFDSESSDLSKTVSTRHEEIEFVRVVVEDDKAVKSGTTFETPASSTARTSVHTKGRWGKVALAAGVVILAVAGAGSYRRLTRQPGNLPPVTSIVVLPFVNESANPEFEYLSDGISESLINNLSQVPKLKVIARSSAFEYKRKKVDVKEVSKALDVNAVLTGRVAQRGDDLWVSVELIDARDRTQIWGERYDRKVVDIEVLEKEITRTISEKLRLRLSGEQTQQLTKRATQSPEAYELYLNGIFYFRKPGLEGVKKSLEYFNRALTQDPNFAPAWLEVGRVNSYFAGNSLVDPKEPLAKAKAALQRALELDGKLADAHTELARIKQSEWNWTDAENEYRRAIELNDNLAEAHQMYSTYLSMMGRHEEALAEIKRAQELDPLRIGLRRSEAFALSLAGRSDEAVEKAERTMILDPPSQGNTYFGLALIYETSGRYQQAIEAYRQAISILGETTSLQCYLGYSLAMSGKRKEALAILQNLKTTRDYVSPTELATLYAGLGDKEAAMTELEKGYTQHDLQLGTLKVDNHFNSLRPDPRFQNLVRRLGLP
jgi:TolB-like protein/DNA-binding winged helix-turn-helix (wHTH) protein/tetratricopeptide (TPR) repeat protein